MQRGLLFVFPSLAHGWLVVGGGQTVQMCCLGVCAGHPMQGIGPSTGVALHVLQEDPSLEVASCGGILGHVSAFHSFLGQAV